MSSTPMQREFGGSSAQTGPVVDAAAEQATRRKFETAAAIVLSIAAVATAWSAYQSTRWSGLMTIDFSRANIERSESIRSSTAAGQRQIVAVSLAADWLNATLQGNQELAADFRVRMPPELDTAMNQWLGQWQQGQPLPDGSPFDVGGYVAPGTAEGLAQERQAEALFADALENNQTSDNYILATVIFASALFFGGIGSRFESLTALKGFVVMATVLMLMGMAFLLIEPKSISL